MFAQMLQRTFLLATARNVGARFSYRRGICPSVRPSVTLCKCFEAVQARITVRSAKDSSFRIRRGFLEI